MPDAKWNLYLFEAIELMAEYDRHIKLIEGLLGQSEDPKGMRLFRDASETEEKQPAKGFNPAEMEEKLKKLQTKRVKLNQAMQKANFDAEFVFDGEQISLSEALEVRKNLLADLEAIGQKISESTYKRVVHKEERDIVHEPKHSFLKTYGQYKENLKKLRRLINLIHGVNHRSIVKFKDE